MAVANIGKRDLFWSMLSTVFRLGSGILLFPFILNKLPSETIGIWVVYTTISSISGLMDFGFKASFARNISYVYSGAKSLKEKGYDVVEDSSDNAVDYSLLKATVKAMQYFYSRVSIVLFILLITIGTYYIYSLAQKYTASVAEIYISWIVLCCLSTYNLYTLYFEALLIGRGNVKNYSKYVLYGNIAYLFLAATFVMLDFGLIAIVASQAVSVLIVRNLSYRCFYNRETIDNLKQAQDYPGNNVIRSIAPNAVKVGLTSLGAFIINKSALFVGSIYLSLEELGSYGITLQLIAVIGSVSYVYASVYMPKIYQWRLESNLVMIRKAYLKSAFVLIFIFTVSSLLIYFLGNTILLLLGSRTQILSGGVLIALMIIQCLETNQYLAVTYLLSKNEVPFLKASLITAFITLLLLYVFVVRLELALWGMILAQGISQLVYQNWKWVFVLIKDLNIRLVKK